MEKLPVDCLITILQRCDYEDVIRLGRTNTLFRTASLKAADFAWAQFANSWGGESVLSRAFPKKTESRAHIYCSLRGREYLNLEPMDENEDNVKFDDIIYARKLRSNGSLAIWAPFCKVPLCPTGTRPSAEQISGAISAAFPETYKKEFLDALELTPWGPAFEFLKGLAQDGGAYGGRVDADVAYPHVIRFLAVMLEQPLHTSESTLFKLAEECTWFWIESDVIWNHGPRTFSAVYWDEFFGAVFPDNRKIIYFESTDTD